MLVVDAHIAIPDAEFEWSYARSGGPGGQNVNKVASKAVLRWTFDASPSLPDAVKMRLRTLQRRRVTGEGDFIVTSERYRDQERPGQPARDARRGGGSGGRLLHVGASVGGGRTPCGRGW